MRGRGRRRRGLFVTFEGIEGSGKSTQLAEAGSRLATLGIPALTTREPGGTAVGEEIRRILLNWSGHLDAGSELLLLFAARRQHLHDVIEPALAEGKVVLCDRYTDASRAYQGAGRRLGEAAVDALHRRFVVREPDRTYLFDCPVETALARVAARGGGAADRFEREALSFHRRVRAGYRRLAAKEPRRFAVIDARPPAADVSRVVLRDLASFLAARGFPVRTPPR